MPSPLYAPLYLAKELSRLGSAGKAFSAFKDVEFRYDVPEPPTDDSLDSLVAGVLSIGSDKNEILAVGDPSRILSAIRKSGCHAPKIAGGFINKMCYTLLGTQEPDGFGPPDLKAIVVHPRGMTAYSVFCHYISTHPKAKTTIDRHEIIFARPVGQEEVWYRTLYALRTKRELGLRGREVVGVISADPARFAGHLPFKKSFVKLWPFHMHAPYDNAAMSAFITWRDITGDAKDTVAGVLEGTRRAIEMIIAEPELCAHYLRRYSDERLRFIGYTEKRLGQTLAWLGGTAKIYNTNTDLCLTREQVTTTLEIREAAALTSDADKVSELRSRIDEFFPLITDGQPEASAVELRARHHETWLGAWEEEIRSDERQLNKEVAVPLYTLSGVGLFAVIVVSARLLVQPTAPFWDMDLLTIVAALVALMPAVRDIIEIERYLRNEVPDPRVGWVPAAFQLIVIPVVTLHGVDVMQDILTRHIAGAAVTEGHMSWRPSWLAITVATVATGISLYQFWQYQRRRNGVQHFVNMFQRFCAKAEAVLRAIRAARFGVPKLPSAVDAQRLAEIKAAQDRERQRCEREFADRLAAEHDRITAELEASLERERVATMSEARDICIRSHAEVLTAALVQAQASVRLPLVEPTPAGNGNGSGTTRLSDRTPPSDTNAVLVPPAPQQELES